MNTEDEYGETNMIFGGFPLPFLLLSLLHSFAPLPSFPPSFLPIFPPSFLRFFVFSFFLFLTLVPPADTAFCFGSYTDTGTLFFPPLVVRFLITCFGLQFYAFEVNTLVFRSALALSPCLCEFELCSLLLVPTFFLTFTATSPTFAHIPSSLLSPP